MMEQSINLPYSEPVGGGSTIEPIKVTPEDMPETPKELTKSAYKKLMRQFFTRELPTVAACGHKVDPDAAPKNNCENCWFALFNSNGERTSMLDQWFRMPGGKEEMLRTHGNTFVKKFGQFMATVEKLKAEAAMVSPMPIEEVKVSGLPVATETMTIEEWNRKAE